MASDSVALFDVESFRKDLCDFLHACCRVRDAEHATKQTQHFHDARSALIQLRLRIEAGGLYQRPEDRAAIKHVAKYVDHCWFALSHENDEYFRLANLSHQERVCQYAIGGNASRFGVQSFAWPSEPPPPSEWAEPLRKQQEQILSRWLLLCRGIWPDVDDAAMKFIATDGRDRRVVTLIHERLAALGLTPPTRLADWFAVVTRLDLQSAIGPAPRPLPKDWIDGRLLPAANGALKRLALQANHRQNGDATGSSDLAAEDSTKRRKVNAVLADAERHLERNPWPGHNAFAKLLNCSPATLSNACKMSPMLLKAKTEYETRTKSVCAKSGQGMGLAGDASSEPCEGNLDEVLNRVLEQCTSDEERQRVLNMPRHEAAEIAGLAFTDADTGKSRRTLNRQ